MNKEDAITQQADAWMAVCATLDEVVPEWHFAGGTGLENAIAAIRKLAARDAQWQAALAEQEPVAWMRESNGDCAPDFHVGTDPDQFWAPTGRRWVPLYTHPAPSTPAAQERAEPVAPAVGEAYWLIECHHGFTGWYDGRDRVDCRFFDKNPGNAKRFTTKEDAEQFIRTRGVSCMLATEHVDLSATTPAPAQPSTEHADLMKFYGVDTMSALAEAQHLHIEKLQAKLPRNDQPAFTRVREG